MLSSILYQIGLCSILIAIVQLVRLFLADADLNILMYEKYGRFRTSLFGKVIWITGASSGIGENLAYLICRKRLGAKIVLSSRRREELEKVKSRCIALGQKSDDIYVVHMDLRDYETHDGLAWSVAQKFDKIDILINCAGRGQCALALDTSLEVDRSALHLNTLGTISLIKAVIMNDMKANAKGQIIYISGLEGKRGMPLSSSCSASSKATQGFLEALRFELAADTDIKISNIYIGPIKNAHYVNSMYVENVEDLNKDKRRLGIFRKQSMDRCVSLILTAIVNEVDEVWIGERGWLIYMYIFQYLPSFTNWLLLTTHRWNQYQRPEKNSKYAYIYNRNNE
ncbi:uncharacterized protein TRIADDRAFT_57231 [Trichoplax adhaerens]|uniref:Dehydrogenase/reductase SDR family member 7 n=1 Tax=Trichoplax adhaerens TaxID=10228 RepID=B3RYV7_TRIAD|nr:hypothetical protein TRIADDRAFT_57231 [Trichoplax adhaerens]EDV24094.1 hypothetical protein TRIADDRAFT_57231 [Trichoplax adhaerens]|eukprot:XP_002113620.1 hypothetical protein TRIADDRAFT_57231 [Trichoplax adhaerens]